VLDKLKSLFFHVKEQDFRTLFTDPPISFAEEYPDVPMPDSEHSPQILAARWITHDLYGEDMPSIAANLLEAGYDTPALCQLAGEIQVACSADVEDLVARMFRDFHVPYPMSEDEAKMIFSRQIAREVIAGKRNAWAAASLTHQMWRWNSENADLNQISELRGSLDWDAVNQNRLPEMTADLITAFARVGAPTDREKRLKHLGFGALEGKGWIADDFDGPLPDDLQAYFDGRHPDPLLDDPV
jgi:hypothetical protein